MSKHWTYQCVMKSLFTMGAGPPIIIIAFIPVDCLVCSRAMLIVVGRASIQLRACWFTHGRGKWETYIPLDVPIFCGQLILTLTLCCLPWLFHLLLLTGGRGGVTQGVNWGFFEDLFLTLLSTNPVGKVRPYSKKAHHFDLNIPRGQIESLITKNPPTYLWAAVWKNPWVSFIN